MEIRDEIEEGGEKRERERERERERGNELEGIVI